MKTTGRTNGLGGERVMEMTKQALIEQLIALARREHFTCEDRFYNCPLSEEGSPIEAYAGTCMCGADKHNAEVERIAAAISAALMTEQRAREILGDMITADNEIHCRSPYVRWGSGDVASLDDPFTHEQLEAIAFWMRTHDK